MSGDHHEAASGGISLKQDEFRHFYYLMFPEQGAADLLVHTNPTGLHTHGHDHISSRQGGGKSKSISVQLESRPGWYSAAMEEHFGDCQPCGGHPNLNLLLLRSAGDLRSSLAT